MVGDGVLGIPNVVSTHSRPKAAGLQVAEIMVIIRVSTHSRPKAAGIYFDFHFLFPFSFNTQPPEGGWS